MSKTNQQLQSKQRITLAFLLLCFYIVHRTILWIDSGRDRPKGMDRASVYYANRNYDANKFIQVFLAVAPIIR